MKLDGTRPIPLWVVLMIAVTVHAPLVLMQLPAKTYDANFHMFMASHYARHWFDPWNERAFAGFSQTTYPPLPQQWTALLSHVIGLQNSYMLIQLAVILLLAIGVYRYSRLWTNERAASYAALGSVFLGSLALLVYEAGQLGTTSSTPLYLIAIPYFYQWMRLGQRKALIKGLAVTLAAAAAHHATLIFGSVLFVLPVVWLAWMDRDPTAPEQSTSRILGRTAVLAVLGVLAVIIVLLPYWLALLHNPIKQVPIPHQSRENFLLAPIWGIHYFVVPYGALLLALPIAFLRPMRDRRLLPLLCGFYLTFLFGLGGTTPVPRWLLGRAFEILTFERFTFWATLMLLPFAGLAVADLVNKYRAKAAVPVCVAAVLTCGLSVSWKTYMPLIGYLPDVQPIIDFMNTSPHDQYRYLTLGLGTQVSKIAIWTHASSVDGDYNSARTLPEMTQYAVAQFSTAKHFGTEGMAALQAMLRHADRYGLKYIFCADRYYEPLLTFGGWRKIREFNGGEITVWWNPFVPPAQKVPSDAVPPRWQALMWGTLPFGSSLFAIVALILFSDRPQRRPDKTRTDDEVEFPPLRPKPVPDFSTVKSAGTMKICLVTAFPPGRGDLNEYGYHLARELHQYPNVSLTVLADRYDKSRGTELPNFEIRRCWSFNSTANPLCLLRELRKIRPNVIWFNMGFSTFGNKPLPAFLGVITAALARMLPARTHITLHTFMGNVDLRDAGVRFPWLYRLGGKLALRILLLADGISVLLPSYRRLLIDEYGASPAKIHVHCHGVFWQGSENTGFNWPRVPTRILALGNWGTYKRLEILLEAFQQLANAVGESRLVIAGASHPKTPGYVESISEQWRSSAKIEFLGYVPEQNLAQLFRSSTVAVLPYTSTAGSSGVVHLASQHGVPIVAADLPQLQELARCEGLAMEFYRGGDADDLARKLQDLLASEEQQRRMAEQNYAAALQLGIAEVVAQYLDCFIREMQREVRPAVLDFA